MATINGYTAERMKEIEDSAIVAGSIAGDNLVLTRYDGENIVAGNVRGPVGADGPPYPNGVNLDQAQTITGVKTFSTPPIASALSVSGLTGAGSASRYVGATAGGKPASGTFNVGDYIIDRGGYIWICTVAGTPGTWVSPSRGVLGLAYTTGVNNQQYSVNAQVLGLSKTVVVGVSRYIKISVRALVINDGSDIGRVIGTINESATPIDRWADDTLNPLDVRLIGTPSLLTPTAGSHTYSAWIQKNTGAGIIMINTGATCSILIEDVGGVS